MKQINIVQFLPYYPPHKGGLETHAQERGNWREKKGYGKVTNVVFDLGYISPSFSKRGLGGNLILLPALELIPTFPIPKFRKKDFRKALSIISSEVKKSKIKSIIITRTRFFTSSLVGGVFAKKNKLKRVHIEHGVDYVKLNAKRKEIIARTYDQTIGRRVFRNSNQVIGISKACKVFSNKFTKKEIPVIYRGTEFKPSPKIEYTGKNIRIGFVGRLVKLKGVDILLKVIKEIIEEGQNINLQIVGDGEEKNNLIQYTKDNKLEKHVKFLGFQDKRFLEKEFYSNIDIIINPSYQEGLPTSVLEGLLAKCVLVATKVGGTPEISDQKDLILVKKGDISDLKKGLEKGINNYNKLSGLSKEHINNNFDWDKNIKKYKKLI